MNDISTEELEAISPEIHEAAVRVGCTHVSVTGKIWPGGQLSGPPNEAARFVEFSWMRAVAVNGKAIFEDTDPQGYDDLLVAYGLADAPTVRPAPRADEAGKAPSVVAPATTPRKVELIAEVSQATKDELARKARTAGMSVGEFLDLVFKPGDRGQL